MSAPVQDAPAVLKIEQSGTVLLSIPDADGKEIEYSLELAPRGFARWAVTLRRLDAKDGPYRVEMLSPGRWKCDCKDAQFRARKEGRRCKHALNGRLIGAFVERMTYPPDPEPPAHDLLALPGVTNAARTPASSEFVAGYSAACREFETSKDAPQFRNPFPPGSESHRGYEEAVYDLTQK